METGERVIKQEFFLEATDEELGVVERIGGRGSRRRREQGGGTHRIMGRAVAQRI